MFASVPLLQKRMSCIEGKRALMACKQTPAVPTHPNLHQGAQQGKAVRSSKLC